MLQFALRRYRHRQGSLGQKTPSAVKTAKEKNVFGVLCSGCIPEGDPVSLHSPSSEDDDEADEEAASNQVWSLTQFYSVDFS